MDLKSSPRHSRRGFIHKGNPASLASALSNSLGWQSEIIDFSPVPPAKTCSVSRNSKQQSKQALREEQESQALLSLLAAELSSLSKNTIVDCRPAQDTKSLPSRATSRNMYGRRPEHINNTYRLNVHTEVLPDGSRHETFDNGSIVNKDALGRVVEIFSGFGECLYFTYDRQGELESFIRTGARGMVHSTGQKDHHGVTVRDCRGRVKAVGECMTVDPWGRFYLHTQHGQYFCLDLVVGIHSERRRIVNPDGRINFVTAAFAHDGFRMATVYARAKAAGARRRQMTYRFYGRDGTVVEFGSEDSFRELDPARSMPPGSFPVHKFWLRRRQAHTAWESVKEYLSREVVQALAP